MSLYELYTQVVNAVDEHVTNSDAVAVCASQAGLDERCGEIYVSVMGGWIASRQSGNLEYYGGFEYVSSEFKESLGEYTFYTDESSRVQKHIEIFEANHQPEPTPEDEALRGIEYVLENVGPLEEGNKYVELFYLERDLALEVHIDSYGRVLISEVSNPADACGEYSPQTSARIISAEFIDDKDKIMTAIWDYIHTGFGGRKACN